MLPTAFALHHDFVELFDELSPLSLLLLPHKLHPLKKEDVVLTDDLRDAVSFPTDPPLVPLLVVGDCVRLFIKSPAALLWLPPGYEWPSRPLFTGASP